VPEVALGVEPPGIDGPAEDVSLLDLKFVSLLKDISFF
jgi:hypothetical protein